MSNTVSLALIVVNFGSSDLVARNFAEVAQESWVTLVVVDNFSTHEERLRVRSLGMGGLCTVIEMDGNPGYGAAANRGLMYAADHGLTWAVVSNPDIAVSAAQLAAFSHTLSTTCRALVSPVINRPDGTQWSAGHGLNLANGNTQASEMASDTNHRWLSGAFLGGRTQDWLSLGGFDETYFMYWEDVDLSFRARRQGMRLVVQADLALIHDVGATQVSVGDRGKSVLYYKYNCRNRLLFASRNLDGQSCWRWLLTAPSYAWSVVMRGGRRQFLSRPGGIFGALIGGTLAGAGYLLRERILRCRRRFNASS